ncbi:ATP-binding cassette domain-containing protein [Lacticaseibacillus suihuaensis]
MIDFTWLYRHLPRRLSLALVLFAFLGGFEGVLNGYVLGQVPNLTTVDLTGRLRYIGVAIALYAGTYLAGYILNLLQQAAIYRWNVALKTQMLQASAASGEAESAGTNRLTNDAAQIQARYFEAVVGLMQNAAMTLVSTWFVLTVNWLMGLIFIAFSAAAMLPMLAFTKSLVRLGQQWSSANAKTLAAAQDWLQSQPELQQYLAATTFFARVKAALALSERRLQQQTARQYTAQFATALMAVLGLFAPMLIGFLLMAHGGFGITIATLLTLQLSADHVTAGVRAVVAGWSGLAGTRALRQLPQVDATPAPAPVAAGPGTVVLDDVSQTFGDQEVLAPTTRRLAAGSKTLIAGPSGVGKTTLLNLIAGRLKPTAGTVTIDDQPATPQAVTYITQQAWIFAGTVRENLTLGQAFSDQQLTTVLTQVGLTDQLGPAPLDRLVAPATLSGGQKQRLAIARGLLRKRPVLLLDEITAGLDDQAAAAIRELLYRLPQTVIEVAHHYDRQLLARDHVSELTLNHELTPVTGRS